MTLPVSVANRAKVPSARISMKTVPSTEYRRTFCSTPEGQPNLTQGAERMAVQCSP